MTKRITAALLALCLALALAACGKGSEGSRTAFALPASSPAASE